MKELNSSDYAEMVESLRTLNRILQLRIRISSYNEIIIGGFAICKVKKQTKSGADNDK